MSKTVLTNFAGVCALAAAIAGIAGSSFADEPIRPPDEKPFFEIWDEEIRWNCGLAVAMDGSVLLLKEEREKGIVQVKRSEDGGKTWPYKKLVKSGPGNYPWMAVGRPGTPSENMVYVLAGKDWCARFNLAWLFSDSEDRPTVEK